MERRRARKSLIDFSCFTMPDYTVGKHHLLISQAIDRMINGDLRRLIVSMPPRHGKSELISRRLPAFILGHNPDENIIATSYSADLASRMNRDCQRIIDSPLYRELFPDTRLNSSNSRTVAGSWLRNSDIFEVVGKKGSYRSSGVDGGITGMGGSWLIIDDPIKNREEADSPTYREKLWNWYLTTLYTRKTPDARILLVMTRWHEDDIAGRLIERAKDDPSSDQWEVISLPAIAGDDLSPLDWRKPGEPLWPEMYGLDELQRIKASIGEYQWAALYDQNPRSGGGTEWPPEYFSDDLLFDHWPERLVVKTTGIDPSKGASAKHGDYYARVNLGLAPDGIMYIEAFMDRLPSEALIDNALEGQRTWRAERIGFEVNQFQELLAADMRRKAQAAGCPVPITPIENHVNKTVRIRRLGPYLQQRAFRFKADSPGTKLLLRQLKNFPTSDHDDGPDAMEMALRMAIELVNGRGQPKQPGRLTA